MMMSRPVYRGTPSAPAGSTGWFDREGVERPVHGRFEAGEGGKKSARTGKPYSLVTNPCSRCGGAGGADQWAHTGWTCFQCGGSGRGSESRVRLYQQDELDVLNERRDASRNKKAAKAKVEREAYEARQDELRSQRASLLASLPFFRDFQALMATFTPERPAPDFLKDMMAQIQVRDLSEKQQAAVEKFIASQKDREARREYSVYLGNVGDRIEITGKVVVCKAIYSNAGYQFGQPEVKYLVKFETADHQTLTWFTSRAWPEGQVLHGKATVKGHKEFGGVKETQIKNFRQSGEIDEKQQELF